MIQARDAFNASYANNIEVQEEVHVAEEYIKDAMKQGRFYVMIPYRLNRAVCTLMQQYGYEISLLEVNTKIGWDYFSLR